MENFEFGALNWSILLLYVIGNLVLGYVVGKKVDTAEDFYRGPVEESTKMTSLM